MGRRRLRRQRRRALPPVVASDGSGYLVGLELEARLFGRVRLLTIEATAAVSDGTALVLDVTPETNGAPATEIHRLPTPRAALDRRRRAGLEEAASLLREAQEMLSVDAGPRR